MGTNYSTLRNLLCVALVVMLANLCSNAYIAMELDRNSDEVASLRFLLQKQLMGPALIQADELQKKMDALNQSVADIDSDIKKAPAEMDEKLKIAQDEFVARLKRELPSMMDHYVKQRAEEIRSLVLKEAQVMMQQAPLRK